MTYPTTRTDAISETVHGVEVRDPYRWLEHEQAPEVQVWMDSQDHHARAWLAAVPERDRLAARLRELFYYDALGAPAKYGERYFYSRKHADKEKTVVY